MASKQFFAVLIFIVEEKLGPGTCIQDGLASSVIDTDRSYLLQLILSIRLLPPPTTITHMYHHFMDTYA